MAGSQKRSGRFFERFYRVAAWFLALPMTVCLLAYVISMTLPSKLELSFGNSTTVQFRVERNRVTLCDHFANQEVVDSVKKGLPMMPAVKLYRGADVYVLWFRLHQFCRRKHHLVREILTAICVVRVRRLLRFVPARIAARNTQQKRAVA